MSIVLNLRIRVGYEGVRNSADLASALEAVAQRFRESGYVEIVKESAGGGQITRAVLDGSGQMVGEFTLMDSSV